MRIANHAIKTLFVVLSSFLFFLSSPAHAASWYSPSSGNTTILNGVDAYSSTALAVGNSGKIIRSTNYGSTWSTITPIVATRLNSVDMEGAHAVAVGDSGVILYSSNSGATWTATASGSTALLYSVSMGTIGTTFAVGSGGTILKSTDWGVTWTPSTSGTTASLRGVTTWNSTTAYAVGTSGTVLYYNGTTWAAQTSGTSATLLCVSMASMSSIWAGGADGVVRKSNGTTWSGVTISGLGTWDNVNGISMNTGVSTGTLVASNDGAYETSDGGATWSIASTGTWINTTWNGVKNFGTNRLAVSYAGTVRRYDGMAPTEFSSVLFNSTATTTSTIYSGTTAQIVTWSAVTDEAGGEILYYIRIDSGAWTATSALSYTTAALSAGSHTISLYAVDSYGSANSTVTQTIFVDLTGPIVGSFTPTSADNLHATLFSVTATDAGSGVDVCYFERDSDPLVELTDPDANGTFTGGYTFDTVESFDGNVSCYDFSGNRGADAAIDFVVSLADTTGPTIGAVTTNINDTGTASTFSFMGSDASGIDSCSLIIQENDEVLAGFHTAISSYASVSATFDPMIILWSASYTFTETGDFYAYAHCVDEAGNYGSSADATFTVSGTEVVDTTAPTVGTPSPTTFTLGTARTISATAADNIAVSSCTLYINGASAGTMTIANGAASKSYTFSSGATATVVVTCRDAAGNSASGTATATLSTAVVTDDEEVIVDDEIIAEEEDVTNEEGDAVAGNLVKLACSEGADVNDPCKAVYFYADFDSKRHAFPNEKVFFTWYENFDDVVVVSDDFMASLTLGRNITYHPGTRMVKFITVNTVYAVTRGGVLRPIDSEATAIALYGSTWNRQIDDISDAFYGNYEFGDDVTSTADYDRENEESSITNIDTNLAF